MIGPLLPIPGIGIIWYCYHWLVHFQSTLTSTSWTTMSTSKLARVCIHASSRSRCSGTPRRAYAAASGSSATSTRASTIAFGGLAATIGIVSHLHQSPGASDQWTEPAGVPDIQTQSPTSRVGHWKAIGIRSERPCVQAADQ